MKVRDIIDRTFSFIFKTMFILLYTFVGSIMLILICGLGYGLIVESLKAIK